MKRREESKHLADDVTARSEVESPHPALGDILNQSHGFSYNVVKD